MRKGRLEGRRIVVTGGASGIGLATARLFMAEGARVALLDRNETALAAAAKDLAALGYYVDVRNEVSSQRALDQAERELGGIDGLVNSAGIADDLRFDDLTVERLKTVLDINLVAVFIMSKVVVPALRRNNGGTIVNISSGIGLRPFLPGQIAYAASKGALIAMTKALAIELSPNVRVNAVCPGLVDTPMSDAWRLAPDDSRLKHYLLGRYAKPGEIADAILYLTSNESSFVTGSSLVIDGGRSLY
jgi:NAD(P)-dependent dehydrogenase (short-subunit alcohol dehydrogenase family)